MASYFGDGTLDVSGAVKTFNAGTPNEARALSGVDLAIAEGSWVVVIGTNGSGKSTLLSAIAGGFALDTGSVRVGGVDVTAWPEDRRARLVGRVFQNPFSGTAANLSVAENLAVAARRGRARGVAWALSHRRREELRARVSELGMGLEDRMATPIGALSGGQRQALTLLMATLTTPRVLLLDEHTAALDPRSGEQVVRLTESVVAKERLTTLMVTHSMNQAAALGDRLVMMAGGRVRLDIAGAAKQRVRADELVARFEEARREERLDESAAEMLRQTYV